MSDLVGIVLAAGAGTRLRPLTSLRPKALCPVGNVPLVDLALARIAPYVSSSAVNVHHGRDQMLEHLRTHPSVHVSQESPEALGTAGALGRLRPWIDGRDVLLTNADSYLDGDLAPLLAGWDGKRPRLLTQTVPGHGDFGSERYVGACLLPWAEVARLAAEPSGLYERMWRRMWTDEPPSLELCGFAGTAIDCGTPRDYLRANLHAGGPEGARAPGAVVAGTATHSVVGERARVDGEIVDSVVWPGAVVPAGERLVGQIRAEGGVTVDGRS